MLPARTKQIEKVMVETNKQDLGWILLGSVRFAVAVLIFPLCIRVVVLAFSLFSLQMIYTHRPPTSLSRDLLAGSGIPDVRIPFERRAQEKTTGKKNKSQSTRSQRVAGCAKTLTPRNKKNHLVSLRGFFFNFLSLPSTFRRRRVIATSAM